MPLRLLIFLLLAMICSGPSWAVDRNSSCVRCHGDREKMRRFGAETMYLDPARVDAEIGMRGVPTCSDCHLGDPAAGDRETAHKGMLAPLLPGLSTARPEDGAAPSAAGKNGKGHVSRMFWHARDPSLLLHLPKNAAKTCGKCHPEEPKGARSNGSKLAPAFAPGGAAAHFLRPS